MAAFTTQGVVASAGQFRFNRIWAGVVGASDEDTQQSVSIVSEGSQWNTSSPASTPMAMSLRANGQSGAPIVAGAPKCSTFPPSFTI